MATERQELGGRIDPEVFNAAVTLSNFSQQRSGTTEKSKLREILNNTTSALNSVTPGGENTLLHLAASVGNKKFVVELLNAADPEVKPVLVKATNAENDTALHLAAQGGFSDVVEILLQQQQNGVNVRNKLGETALFRAYESGNLATVEALFKASPLSLLERTEDKRTCLTVAVNRGDSDLVGHLLYLSVQQKDGPGNTDLKELVKVKDEHGNTALHIAVERNYVDIIQMLMKFEAELCYLTDESQETPLCVAAKLGHLEAVKELIEWRPDAVEIRNNCGMNVLHLAAQVSQVRIVDHLKEKVGLSYLVNKGLDKSPEEEPLRSGEKADPDGKKKLLSRISEGDTPLHIAARKKNLNMVKSLLCIVGINKFAVNKAGLTTFDIVRENTEYHESDKIIAVLANYPSKCKPFLYSSPKVSPEKHEVAIKTVDKTFEDRRNTELVVAVLLATMSFTAAFTVPGGFVQDGGPAEGSPAPSPSLAQGSPILLGLDSLKVFLIFDCLAFFLSLFVVLMWQMSTPITTGNKILFLCVTNLLVCATFAFTAYGFMLAVYSMLDGEAHKLAWVILGVCLFICCCGNFTFFYMAAIFSVKKARFNHLNGLLPYLTDRVGECVWMKLERWGPLDMVRRCKAKWLAIFYCDSHDKDKL